MLLLISRCYRQQKENNCLTSEGEHYRVASAICKQFEPETFLIQKSTIQFSSLDL